MLWIFHIEFDLFIYIHTLFGLVRWGHFILPLAILLDNTRSPSIFFTIRNLCIRCGEFAMVCFINYICTYPHNVMSIFPPVVRPWSVSVAVQYFNKCKCKCAGTYFQDPFRISQCKVNFHSRRAYKKKHSMHCKSLRHISIQGWSVIWRMERNKIQRRNVKWPWCWMLHKLTRRIIYYSRTIEEIAKRKFKYTFPKSENGEFICMRRHQEKRTRARPPRKNRKNFAISKEITKIKTRKRRKENNKPI